MCAHGGTHNANRPTHLLSLILRRVYACQSNHLLILCMVRFPTIAHRASCKTMNYVNPIISQTFDTNVNLATVPNSQMVSAFTIHC